MSANASSSGGSGSGSVTTSTSGGGGGPCGACKFLRRKCVAGCIFAPYFDSEQGAAHFAAVHKVFGASNASKLLLYIPVNKRLDAVVTICYEAQARLRDPVYGCVAHIFALQQQVVNLQAELSYIQAHLAALELPTPPPQPPPPPLPPQLLLAPPHLLIPDLPAESSTPTTYDLSTLFEPMVQPSCSWTTPHQQIDPQQYGGTRTPLTNIPSSAGGGGDGDSDEGGGSSSGGGDLHALARELLQRHGSSVPVPCTEASPLPPHST